MKPEEKTTLVLGASSNPDRVSYQAMRLLAARKIPFIAIGLREYEWDDIKILKGKPGNIGKIHTVTLYLGAKNQKEYYDYILSLSPERIIFNPGTQNDEMADLAIQNGIEVVDDCMLVMIKQGRF